VGRSVTVRFRLTKSAVPPRPVVTRPEPVEPRVPPEGATPKPKKEEPAKKRSPKLWWQIAFYSSAGLAVAMFIGSIVTGKKVLDLQDDKTARLKELRTTNPGASWIYGSDVCSNATDARIVSICNDGEKYANITNGLIVTGSVLAVAAGVFTYFAFIKDYPKEKAGAEGASVPGTPGSNFSLTPEVWQKGAGVKARLNF